MANPSTCITVFMMKTPGVDPVHEAIRAHQIALVRFKAAARACSEMKEQAALSGIRPEECGLLLLETWSFRMEWAAYYALQCLLSTIPTTDDGLKRLRTYARAEMQRAELSAGFASPSFSLLRTWEVLERFLEREA